MSNSANGQFSLPGNGEGIPFQPSDEETSAYNVYDNGAGDSQEDRGALADVRETACVTISIAVVLSYVLVLRRLLLDDLLYVAASWVAWGIAVLLAGAILCKVFAPVLGFHGRDKTTKRVMLWLTVLVCGLVVSIQFPSVYEESRRFFASLLGNTEIYKAELFVKTRVAPLHVIGAYVNMFYIAVVVMLFTGIVSGMLNGEVKTSKMFSCVKVPVFIVVIALALSFVNHRLFTLDRVWAALLLIAVFGMHRTLVRIMKHFRFVGGEFRRGPLLYLSIRDISKPAYSSEVDKVVVLAAGGLTLLTQVAAVVFFIVFVAKNFSALFLSV